MVRSSLIHSVALTGLLQGSFARDCNYAPEIVLVQDITTSYQESLDQLFVSMPKVFDMLRVKFPGTKFGVTSFLDDPSCGSYGDWCAHLEQSLLSPDAKDMVATQKIFSRMKAGGGGDLPENIVGAIIRTVLSPQVGFSAPNVTHNEDGQPIIRILIATTDCVFHLPGEKTKCAKAKDHRKYTAIMPTDNGDWLKDSLNAQCNYFDYPNPIVIKRLLKEKEITPIFLFGRGTYYKTRHTPQESFDYKDYHAFASRFKYNKKTHPEFFDPHFEDGLTKLMTLYLKEQLDWEPLIATVDDTMTNFQDMLEATLTKAVKAKCLETTTTTTTTTVTSTSFGSRSEGSDTAHSNSVSVSEPSTTPSSSPTPFSSVSAKSASTAQLSTEPAPTARSQTAQLSTVSAATSLVPTESLSTHFASAGSGTEVSVPTSSITPTGSTGPTAPTQSHLVTSAGRVSSTGNDGKGGKSTTTGATGGNGGTTTATTEAGAGPNLGVIIGSASGGVAALAAVAAGSVRMYKFFTRSSTPDMGPLNEAEIPEVQVEREAFEPVTADLFT